VNETRRFRQAAVDWVAGGAPAEVAARTARDLAACPAVRTVVLVEGTSDAAAVERLAVRRGRDLEAEGICILPLGGATSIGRFMALFVQQEMGVKLAGLCDVGEEDYFRRALERAGFGSGLTREDMTDLGFHVCVADLEDELIRAHRVASVQDVIEAQGELRSFRTFQMQPAQRERSLEQQLHRFMGTHSGRKLQYADALVESLDLDRVPDPLNRLLADI
jgi:hypothetical protein